MPYSWGALKTTAGSWVWATQPSPSRQFRSFCRAAYCSSSQHCKPHMLPYKQRKACDCRKNSTWKGQKSAFTSENPLSRQEIRNYLRFQAVIGDQGEGWKRGKGFINKEDDSFGVCHTNERKLYYFTVSVLLKDSLQQVFFPHPALFYQGKSVRFIITSSPSANIFKGDGLVTARDTCFVSICICHD